MAQATTTTMAGGIPSYYDRRLLARAIPVMVHYQMAQKGRSVGLGSGQGHTVYWTRYLPLTKRTTALTETDDGGITRAAISDMTLNAQCKLYGNVAQIGRYIDLVHIDQNIANRVDLLAQNMGESVDWLVMDAIHGADHSINRIRIDNDSDYTIDATADSTTCSTTVISDSDLSQTTSAWVGGYALITDPTSKAYGESRIITANDGTTFSVTIGTISETPASKTYRLVQSTGISGTTDIMSSAGVRYAVRELKRKKALKFADGNYAAILPIDMEYDFMKDTTWVAAKEYSDVKDLYAGEIGRWMGVRFVTPSIGGDWREAAGTMGTLSTSAAVYTAPFFGKGAVGVVDLKAQPQKVYVRTWEQLGQPIPLFNTIGWEASLATKVLNANFAVGLMCSATT